jgi:hypothetical protein
MKGQKDLRQAAAEIFPVDDVAPGDEKSRATFFNHSLQSEAILDGKPVKLVIDRNVKLPWYGHGHHSKRIPLTIPLKLRENMRALLGVDAEDDYAVTTTIVALADYACQVLSKTEGTLRVQQVKGPVKRRAPKKAL